MQNSYQILVDYLCDKYDFIHIKVVFDHKKLTRPGIGGQYNFQEQLIVVDENEDENLFMDIVYHEFRHYWQHIFYGDLFIWWTCCSGRLYREFYNTDFCSIEADARLYGTSYGALGREDLLKSFSTSQLSMCRDDENILRQTLENFEAGRNHN